jgi:hypothetical protein
MPSMNRLSTHATTIAIDENHCVVTYHNTPIVKYNDIEIIINFGDFDTVTTRRKMNQAANQFRLPYSVYRKNGKTFVKNNVNENVIPYDGDKIVILR